MHILPQTQDLELCGQFPPSCHFAICPKVIIMFLQQLRCGIFIKEQNTAWNNYAGIVAVGPAACFTTKSHMVHICWSYCSQK